MRIIQNTEVIKTPFYACENYETDQNKGSAPPCFNRINMDDYQGIVLKFIELMDKHGPLDDFTNCSFSYKGSRHKINVKVLRYTEKEIVLGILNTTVLGGGRN